MEERSYRWPTRLAALGHWTWFTLGIAALIALGALMPLVGTVFVMASDPCHDDPELICTAPGQEIAFYSPVLGAAAGLLVATAGTAVKPSRRSLWLALGYFALLTGWLTGCAIASGAP